MIRFVVPVVSVCLLTLSACRVRGETTELFMKGSVAESSETVVLDPVFLSQQKRVESMFFGFAPDSPAETNNAPALASKTAPKKPLVADRHDEESINIEPKPEYFQPRNSSLFNKLIWPVSSGTLTSKFGMRHGRLHAGIDIGAPRGEPIFAVADGQVLTAKRKNGYGLVVVLGHESDHQTLYGHMTRFAVREGQFVRRGAVIGYVGMSGTATGFHLHFETRVAGGMPQNPLRFLPGGVSLSKNEKIGIKIARR